GTGGAVEDADWFPCLVGDGHDDRGRLFLRLRPQLFLSWISVRILLGILLPFLLERLHRILEVIGDRRPVRRVVGSPERLAQERPGPPAPLRRRRVYDNH